MFQSTKTFPHSLGISAAFRQWRAESHCRFIHGYPLEFKFTFGAMKLDDKGWVVDFGALKPVKESLVETFDHKLIVAGDDPELELFKTMHERGVADVVIFPDGVGCERFARHAFALAESFLVQNKLVGRVWVASVEVREHDGNSAIFYGEHK